MLKIMTLNINYRLPKHGPWTSRRELIRQVIASAEPDIIALQAVEAGVAVEPEMVSDSVAAAGAIEPTGTDPVTRDPAAADPRDQAAQFAALLPEYAHVVFQPAVRTPDGTAQGSAFLSRLPFSQPGDLLLGLIPDLEDTNQRVLLSARLELDSGPLHVFNAHFSWVPEQVHANIDQALPLLNSFAGPALMVGDLNQTPDSLAMRRFLAAGWTDAWATLRPGENGYTFETPNPTMRIDYAWANRDCAPRLRAIEIIADRPDEAGHTASDHFGLLVTLD